MSGIPILPKEVAVAIEDVKKYYTTEEIIKTIVSDRGHVAYGSEMPTLINFARHNGGYLVDIAAALINGYEIEKTPEEKVREYYEELHERCEELSRGDCISYSYYAGKSEGLWETLDLLEIKIAGINT